MKRKKKIVIILIISIVVLLIVGINRRIAYQNRLNEGEDFEYVAELGGGTYDLSDDEATEADKVKAQQHAQPEKKTKEITEKEVTYFAQDKAIVRYDPYPTADIQGSLRLDERVAVTGYSEDKEFYKVKVNGKTGYVAISDLSEEYIDVPLPISSSKSVPTAKKDILFIGNSITLYPATKDWWGSGWGCGATSIDKDYVHLTVAKKGYKSFDFMSLRSWEFSDTRNNEVDDLDPYITKYQYGTIVIELGENVKGHETHFQEDLGDMVKYIKTYNPNAKVVILDNFWPYQNIISAKKAVAKENGLTYVSLADIQGDKQYQLQQGDSYTTPDGRTYTIGSFLAGHPNDAGFAAIAERLAKAL